MSDHKQTFSPSKYMYFLHKNNCVKQAGVSNLTFKRENIRTLQFILLTSVS